MRISPDTSDFETSQPIGRRGVALTLLRRLFRRRNGARPGSFLGVHLYRQALLSLRFRRILRGGGLNDRGRLPRYELIFCIGLAIIWTPLVTYLALAPKKYTSTLVMILPGAGVSSSVNLSEIGQATSSANSAYASTSLSPSVTYKNLLESDRVIEDASAIAHLKPRAFGKPVIKLVDETSLINISVTGPTPEKARSKSRAILAAFNDELDSLRNNEIAQRNASAAKTIADYQAHVDSIRARINALETQSGLTSAEQYASIVLTTETLQTQVAETEAQLRQKEGAVASLSSLLKVSPQVAALTLKLQADEETGALTEAVSKAASDTAQLEKQYGPNHPKYRDARAKEAGARARLIARGMAISGLAAEKVHAEVDSSPKGERPTLLARLVTEMMDRAGLAAQLRSQRAALADRRLRIQDLVQTGSKLDALNRDYKIADAVFASALARVDTSKADIFASYPMAQVVDPPSLPHSPSSPSLKIGFGAGIAASFLLSIGLVMAWVRGAVIDRIVAKPEPQDPPVDA